MPVFNNQSILINPSDYLLGGIYFDKNNFDFNIYKNLLNDRINDLIDIYVGEKIKYAAKNFPISEQDVLDDLAAKVSEKLRVAVYGNDSISITNSIMESDAFGRFITKMKDGFKNYEDNIGTLPMPVPLSEGESEDSYYTEERVSEIIDNTNIIEYIETLETYGLTELL